MPGVTRPQSRLKFISALFAVTMVAVLSALDQTIVSTALPHIIASLQGVDLLGWVFTAYFLGATATVMVTGKLADLLGQKVVFLTAVVLFCVGSLLCGVSNSMLLLVAFRGLQGVGAGGLQTCSLIVMGNMFSPRERGKWQAINSVGFATASAIGPTLGGLLSDNLSWRWIFLANVPLCAITIGAIIYGLSSAPARSRRPTIDWAGGALSMAAVICLLLALTWGGRTYSWASAQIILLLAGTMVLGALLWRVERRAAEPIVPGSLLKNRIVVLCGFSIFGTMGIWFGLILLAPLRLQLVMGSSATAAGAVLTPGVVLSAVCAFLCGQVLSRTGRYHLMCLLTAAFNIIGLGMLLSPPPIDPSLWVALGFLVAGIGTGFGVMSFMIAFRMASLWLSWAREWDYSRCSGSSVPPLARPSSVPSPGPE